MKYQLKQASRFVCGSTSFGLSAGTIVEVKQHDQANNKVLIDFGGRLIDWFHVSYLDQFAPILTGVKDD
jgi:hypothetical protein